MNEDGPPDAKQSQSNSNQQYTIGHYVLGKALGEGTFGKVKLGTHILTGEKVAVKVLEKSRIKDKKDVERISREIKILKQLHHPNVVQIYEIIETEKDLYLVMEFVQGGELFDQIVQSQRLKEKDACKYFKELISGINYIHQLGICHRDLKPENLLVDYDKSLKIVDFGLSNLYEQGDTLKTACGSPCYAAPEMIAGNRYNGLMSDLWSVGVVLYAMLCGYLPYEDQKTSDLYKKILNAQYTLPDFLSDEAKDMINKIFVTNPNQRITIDQIRKHPWYNFSKQEVSGFYVCPPTIQSKISNVVQKGGKNYTVLQRPNLLNQKIISNLETQQGFNRESLLKSIKNNKHNHLTATYYLLLKKHMIRQMKPYCDAFMELKLVTKEDTQDIKLNNQRYSQQPQLKSKQDTHAVDKNSSYPIKPQGMMSSIDHTEITNQVKRNNFVDTSSSKYVVTRQSQNSSLVNDQFEDEEKKQIEFNNQTTQNFVKKQDIHKPGKHPQRKEQSAHPPSSMQQKDLDQRYSKERNSRWTQQQSKIKDESLKLKHQESSKQEQERNNSHKQESDKDNSHNHKKRAGSLNIHRNDENEYSDNLDKAARKEQEQIQYEYIQSKNMKQQQKGNHREVRAPSTGSNTSQPRVQVAGSKASSSTNYQGGNGQQKKYDSIDNHRQSQIDKFLQSQQDQIVNIMKLKPEYQEKYSKKGAGASGKDNLKKNSNIDSNYQEPASNLYSQSQNNKKPTTTREPNEQNINLGNVVKGKHVRNNKNENCYSQDHHDNPIQSPVQNQNIQTSQYYRQLQQQLDLLNQRRSGHNQQELEPKVQNNQPAILQSNNSGKENKVSDAYKTHSNNTNQNSIVGSQKNSGKQMHRKAKSMSTQNGLSQDQQKHQHAKVNDAANIKQLLQQFASNQIPKQTNQGPVNLQLNSQVQESINHSKQKHAPSTMPQAPKSGNILKIKQQVARNKSSIHKSQQSNSMTTTQATIQQRSNGNSLQIQQQISGPKKKQQMLHTTKNVSGQTHQHNFELVEQKQHLISVQHSSNNRKSLNPQAQSSGSNFFKQNIKQNMGPSASNSLQQQPTIQNSNSCAANEANTGYLQNLIKEYEKSQQLLSGMHSQVQINNEPANAYMETQNIRNINAHQQRGQATIAYEDQLLSSELENARLSQKQIDMSFKNHSIQVDRNHVHSQLPYSNVNQKYDNAGEGKHHYQTQDHRIQKVNIRERISNQEAPQSNYSKVSSIPDPQAQFIGINDQSSAISINLHKNQLSQPQYRSDKIQLSNTQSSYQSQSIQQQKQRGNSISLNTTSARTRHKQEMNPSSAVLNQQPEYNQDYKEAKRDHRRGHSANISNQQQQRRIANENDEISKQELESKIKNGSTKISIMSKYNQQQKQEQVRSQNSHGRHNSAPRDRELANQADIQREQLRNKHLMNQSVDMSQIMHLQKQIAHLSQQNDSKPSKVHDEKHNLQLQNYGQNPSKNSKTIQNYSVKPNQLSNTQGLKNDNSYFNSTMKHSHEFQSYNESQNLNKRSKPGHNYERDKLASAQTEYSSQAIQGEHREQNVYKQQSQPQYVQRERSHDEYMKHINHKAKDKEEGKMYQQEMRKFQAKGGGYSEEFTDSRRPDNLQDGYSHLYVNHNFSN